MKSFIFKIIICKNNTLIGFYMFLMLTKNLISIFIIQLLFILILKNCQYLYLKYSIRLIPMLFLSFQQILKNNLLKQEKFLNPDPQYRLLKHNLMFQNSIKVYLVSLAQLWPHQMQFKLIGILEMRDHILPML